MDDYRLYLAHLNGMDSNRVTKIQVLVIWVVTLCSDVILYHITTWCHTSEDHNLNLHHCENIRSRNSYKTYVCRYHEVKGGLGPFCGGQMMIALFSRIALFYPRIHFLYHMCIVAYEPWLWSSRN